jgi:hypothetical protein
MAMDAAPLGETSLGNRTMGKLRLTHRSWVQMGKPANLKRHTIWVYGQEFDVLEDEIGVVEVRRHRGPGYFS